MGKKPQILLPEGFEKTELHCVNFENGDEILRYCSSCVRKSNCRMSQTLRSAMGENFPYWSPKFVAVKVPTPHLSFTDSETRVFCLDYTDSQLSLPGMPRGFSDGVERLLDFAERGRREYTDVNGAK